MTWSILYSLTWPIFSVLLWMFTVIIFSLLHGHCQWQLWFDLTVIQKVYYMIKTKNQPAVSRVRALAPHQRDWQRANAQNTSFLTLYHSQFMLSTQLIITNYPVILSHQCNTSKANYPLYSYLQYLWSWRTSSVSTTCRAIRWLHFSLAAKTPHFKILKL